MMLLTSFQMAFVLGFLFVGCFLAFAMKKKTFLVAVVALVGVLLFLHYVMPTTLASLRLP